MEYDYIKIPKADPRDYTREELQDILRKMMTDYSKFDEPHHPKGNPTFDQKLPQIMFYLIYESYINKLSAPDQKWVWNIIEPGNDFRSKACNLPKLIRTMVPTFVPPVFTNETLQKIYYGAPGGGKSHKAKERTSAYTVFRTTFHPDTDYACFVGSYKPKLNEKGVVRNSEGRAVDDEYDKKIEYSFIPQVFTNAYIEAWNRLLSGQQDPNPAPVCLLIEELNRGNCAQIFGDLFQLLDRNSSSYSEYSIIADSDLADYIKRKLGDDNFKKYYNVIQENCDLTKNGRSIPEWDPTADNDVRLCLPPNLSIVCTMNTSDQSLFPMDSAFKRRWEWEYVPIDYDSTKSEFVIVVDDEHRYNWLEFLYSINTIISEETKSEDKQLGNFFVKGDENNEVSSDLFVSKVMHFLWNDVCKDNPKARKKIFTTTINGNSKEFSFNQIFSKDRNNYIIGFMESLKVPTVISEPDNTGVSEPDTTTKKFTKYSVNGVGAFSRQSVAWEAVKEYSKINNLNPANTSDVNKLFSEWDSFNVKKMTSAYPLISKTQNSRSKKIPEFEIYINNRDWFIDNFTQFMNDVNNKPSLGIKIATV